MQANRASLEEATQLALSRKVEWKNGRIGDLLIGLESGVSVNGEERTPAAHEVGVLKVSSVTYGVFNPSASKAVIASEIWRVRTNPKAGQIIISRSNTEDLVGASAFVFEDHPNLFLSDKLWQTVPAEGADMRWLSYCISSTKIRYTLSRLATGTSGSMKNITQDELLSLRVAIPPLPEQKKIAQILSTWDAAIAANEELLANSQQRKKALMQKLLTGKVRLPEFVERSKNEPFELRRISDIAVRIQRKSDGGDHPILTISSLTRFVRQDERYGRYMAGESVKNYILLKKGEFAYNKGNSKSFEFGCIFDLHEHQTGLVPNVYVCFKLKKGFCSDYFKYLFEADYLKPQLRALVNSGVRNNGLLNISPTEFMSTKVPVPSYDEQEQIADIIRTSSEEIEALEHRLNNLKLQKKALMQQLLTGKKRVKVEPITQ